MCVCVCVSADWIWRGREVRWGACELVSVHLSECNYSNGGLVVIRETIGPCWLLKLRWIGTQKEFKWKGSFLGWFVGLVVLVQRTFILPSWLLWSAQNKILISSTYTVSIYVSHRQAARAGNRAGPPVSECVSKVSIVQQTGQEAVLGRLSLSVCLWWSLFFIHLFFFFHTIIHLHIFTAL